MVENFEKSFARMQAETHGVARHHGFQTYQKNYLYVPTKLALIMSEAAEALEAHRQGKESELTLELADIIIRTMDLAESLGINLGKAIVTKHRINATRDYMHGNKRY